MAIADVAEYDHLSDADLKRLEVALEAIRRDIEDSRGEKDRAYIRRAIAFRRCLDLAARLVIAASRSKAGWALGTTALAAAKSIENMELGHNICHGQWDWMNDPEIHSSTWKWDMAGVSSQWRFSHNYRHHVFTNVIGVDDDLGYGVVSCGSPATSNGGSAICCSLCETCCWPSCLNGASHCRVCIRRIRARRATLRNLPSPVRWSARLPGRPARTICSFPHSAVDDGAARSPRT